MLVKLSSMQKFDSITFTINWQEEAEQTTKPILDALGDDYSICCQGKL